MYKTLPDNHWINQTLESSDPGLGAVTKITWDGNSGLFIRTFDGWNVRDEFDYESIKPGKTPDSIEVLSEGHKPSDFKLGDRFSPDGGRTIYTYLPQQNWREA